MQYILTNWCCNARRAYHSCTYLWCGFLVGLAARYQGEREEKRVFSYLSLSLLKPNQNRFLRNNVRFCLARFFFSESHCCVGRRNARFDFPNFLPSIFQILFFKDWSFNKASFSGFGAKNTQQWAGGGGLLTYLKREKRYKNIVSTAVIGGGGGGKKSSL